MAEGRNRAEALRSGTSATETVRRERQRAEERHSAEKRDALLRDHSFCEICGHRFYDPRLAEFHSPLWSASINNDPLQREEDYLVHFMAEHMLDELNAGHITDDDVNDLANYLEVSKANRRKLVLGLSESDAEKDPLLRQSFRHHSQLRRIDNCFAAFLTMFIVNHVIEGVAFAMRGSGGAGANANKDADKDAGEGEGAGVGGTEKKKTRSLRPTTADGAHYMGQVSSAGVPANDWAAVQCQTSVNWASGSWFWNHFSGGLNHQIEHHLFPSICHTNYVHIQDVVQSTCEEFGVPYRSEASLWTAYWAMVAHLRNMGNCDTHASWDVGL